MNHSDQCHCCSEKNYTACCQPYLMGDLLPPDPESTMRSRYTAFCLNDLDYLKKTWHPDTYPCDLNLDHSHDWISLEIIEVAVDEDEVEGEVEFIAKLIDGAYLETLHEVSQFEKIAEQWVYHSGEFKNTTAVTTKISRRSECPCKSGKLFKHCHGGRNSKK